MWLGVLRAVLYGMVVLTLVGAAFVAGIITSAHTAKPPPAESVLEIAEEDRAVAHRAFEEALAARFAGRPREALSRLEEARSFHPSLPGLQFQLALASLDLGEFAAAGEHARRSLERGEEAGSAQALRGLILLEESRREGATAARGEEILGLLQASRAADPLNPMPLYVMAEYYRAAGRPEAAVAAYRRALERVSPVDSHLVSTVKAGLAGRRLGYRAGEPPLRLEETGGVLAPEQLFFGAADALQRGDKEAAAGYLREARRRLPEEVFQALLQDPFFQDYLPGSVLPDLSSPLP